MARKTGTRGEQPVGPRPDERGHDSITQTEDRQEAVARLVLVDIGGVLVRGEARRRISSATPGFSRQNTPHELHAVDVAAKPPKRTRAIEAKPLAVFRA